MSGPAKALLVLALVLVVWFNPWLLPVAVVFGGAYVLYLGARGLVLCCRGSGAAAGGGRRPCVSRGDPMWQAAARETLRKKPASERVSELTGSMLMSASVAAVLCLLFLLLQGSTLDGSVAGWAVYAWLTVTSTLGAWTILAMGKFWEGDGGDHFRRRFVMLVVGLAIGAVAFGASQMFLVDLPDQDQWTVHTGGRLLEKMYGADGAPLLAAHLVYFAGLFVVLRWWSQMDPLRKTRLSIWATAVCVLWAWIMHMFCRFPQPWGFVVAATISIAVQLAAPWANPKDQEKIMS
jgi:hypothetical protein